MCLVVSHFTLEGPNHRLPWEVLEKFSSVRVKSISYMFGTRMPYGESLVLNNYDYPPQNIGSLLTPTLLPKDTVYSWRL